MTEFKYYRRVQIAEMRPYEPGEVLSDDISVSAPDRDNGSPKEGDMIARNPQNHQDQWLVAAKYFADNFEALSDRAALELARLGASASAMNEPYEVPKFQPGPCIVCGLTDYPLSMGGSQICPACDCGISPTDSRHPLRHKNQLERLQATLEAIDDHGRAGSFVETLKAKDKRITELTDAIHQLAKLVGGGGID